MSHALSSLVLPSLFADHMVVQRDAPLPVWGWARPGTDVSVALTGESRRATADENGRWMVSLEPVAGPGPYEMRVDAAGQTTVIRDVLAGEVWLCSGQSNMNFPLARAHSAEQDVPTADFPSFRYFMITNSKSRTPRDNCPGAWRIMSPKTAPDVSAVGYYFLRDVHRELGVPVGLIHVAWGGASIEPFLSMERIRREPELQPVLEKLQKTESECPGRLAEYEQEVDEYLHANRGLIPADFATAGLDQGWQSIGYDDSAWDATPSPFVKPSADEMPHDGVVWFRNEVTIPDAWLGRDLDIDLGVIDAQDKTFVNGQLVGETGLHVPCFWLKERVYRIPAALVTGNRLVVAVRTLFQQCGGNAYGAPEEKWVRPAGSTARIEGIRFPLPWKHTIAACYAAMPAASELRAPMPWPAPSVPWDFHQPSVIYNGMIHPIIPYAMRGAAWYQGESNADAAWYYRTLLTHLIDDWRSRWKQQCFHFGIVQLANFGPVTEEPVDNEWAEIRESQFHVSAELAHVGIVTAVDVGEADDVHPTDKKTVGKRLARWALACVYRGDIPWSGPRFEKAEPDGSAITVWFTYAYDGLCTGGETGLRGFEIAGSDLRFHFADAAITGTKTVRVSSDAVCEPRYVRYSWAQNPTGNLYNSVDLPAFPFRTDDKRPITFAGH